MSVVQQPQQESVGMSKLIMSVRAYCKMLLHAMKYPHCQVNGVLLSAKSKSKSLSLSGSASQTTALSVVDCVPLFHQSPLNLAPMYEIALTQIDIHCQKENLYISGYYQANEHMNDTQPDKVAFKVSDTVADNAAGSACLVMIDNRSISVDCEEIPLRVHLRRDGRWRPQDHGFVMVEGGPDSMAAVSTLLRSKTYREITDFDNHLDDISKDWRNTKIDDKLYHALQQ